MMILCNLLVFDGYPSNRTVNDAPFRPGGVGPPPTIAHLRNHKVHLSKRNVILQTLNNEVQPIPLAKRIY